jgi:hypothetical protein
MSNQAESKSLRSNLIPGFLFAEQTAFQLLFPQLDHEYRHARQLPNDANAALNARGGC